MQIDSLVEKLAQDLRPVRRRNVARDALILGVAGLVELGGFLWLGLMRHDMPLAMGKLAFWWKLASMGLIALVGASVALFSFNPTHSPRSGLRWIALIVVLCLAAGWGIDASRDGWPALAARVNWRGGWHCVAEMGLLSLPALVGLGLLMRRDAPTDTGGTSWAVGIASAAWGAFVFVFSCPYDDPLFVSVWYATGCGLVTVAARLILPVLTRW